MKLFGELKMSFTEKELENVILEKIQSQGYNYISGDNIERNTKEDVLIESDLTKFLETKYRNEEITKSEIDSIITSFKSISHANLYDSNKTVFLKMVDGEIFKREDKNKKDFHLQLFDFDNIENNIFTVCNQFKIIGKKENRIPDAIIFINGIPVVVFEFKSMTNENVLLRTAYVQITTRYKRDIPELFKYNAFCVISDGVNSKMGSLFSSYEHFYSWRKVDDDDDEVDGCQSLDTMIRGVFRKDRILNLIHNFIYFPDDSSKELKVICNYPQYFATTKLLKNVLIHKKPNGDGKGGTYFGTTGCGKSYAMLFLTRLLMRCPELKSPTIILITDRTDLDDQLSGIFVKSKRFIGDKDVSSVLSRDDLREKLLDKKSGGVYLTTIQKFTEKLDLLTARDNVICISDEAHRSQINLEKNVKITEKNEVKESYGYAKYLHDSLPNATYIGFTGTPIQKTIDIFGNIVESYTMHNSIADGITVDLVYDGRFVKAVLDSEEMKKIEAFYKKCLEEGANEYQVEESKKKSVSVHSIIGDREILRKIAENFVEHYESRVKEGSTVAGKCMFVCDNRNIAFDFYKILKELRPEWVVEKKCPDILPQGVTISEDDLNKMKPYPMMKMVMTRGKDDPEELYNLLGNDSDRAEAALYFKDIKSNFKIVILVDMWLTGFDVPFLDTIYIDKVLTQQHGIIQTISRVNRAYENKYSGLIVDFIGIKEGIDWALKRYTNFEPEDIRGIEKAVEIVLNQIEILDNIIYKKIDCRAYFEGNGTEKYNCLNRVAEFVQQNEEFEYRFMENTKRLSRAFSLCNPHKDFTSEQLDKIHFYMGVRSIIFKLTKGDAPDISQMNRTVQRMVQEAVKANGGVEYLFKIDNKNECDLFDINYLEKINKMELPNTKIKLLEQLLNQAIGEFKKVNKVKAENFSKRLQKIVDSYNRRSLTNADEVKAILDDVNERLFETMRDLIAEQKSFTDLGIKYEEKAFLDVLVAVEEKYDFEFPEDKNQELAKKIYELVDKTSDYTDWLNRSDIKSKLKSEIMMLLYQNGFPPMPDKATCENYKKVYNDVIEQAENFKKYN